MPKQTTCPSLVPLSLHSWIWHMKTPLLEVATHCQPRGTNVPFPPNSINKTQARTISITLLCVCGCCVTNSLPWDLRSLLYIKRLFFPAFLSSFRWMTSMCCSTDASWICGTGPKILGRHIQRRNDWQGCKKMRWDTLWSASSCGVLPATHN